MPDGLEEPGGEVAALPELGDVQLERAETSVEAPRAIAVAAVGALGAAASVWRAGCHVGLRGHERLDGAVEELAEEGPPPPPPSACE